MNNNPNQPREFDAVLGGQAPPPVDGVVLGGLASVKNRLKSSDVEVKITALSQALNYGEAGLDLLINTLPQSSGQMQRSVARLLRKMGGHKGKQALLSYDPWLFFKKLEDWNQATFYSQLSIFESLGTVTAVQKKNKVKICCNRKVKI